MASALGNEGFWLPGRTVVQTLTSVGARHLGGCMQYSDIAPLGYHIVPLMWRNFLMKR